MKVTSVPYLDSGGYSEKVSIHVWLKNDGTQSSHSVGKQSSASVITVVVLCLFPLPDLDKSPKIEISDAPFEVTIYPFRKREQVCLCICSKAHSCMLITRLLRRWFRGRPGGGKRMSFVILCSFLMVLFKKQKKGKISVKCSAPNASPETAMTSSDLVG